MGSALFACTVCGKKFRWKPEIAGKAGRCGCGSRIVAPSTPESTHTAEAPELSQHIALQPVVAIPAMQPGVTRADEALVGSVVSRTSAPEADEDLYDIVDDSRPSAASKARFIVGSGGLCPACSGALQNGAVLCVACGLDLRRNAKLGVDERLAAEAKNGATSPAHRPAPARPHSAMAFPATSAFKPVLEEDATPAMPKTLLETTACVALIALGIGLTLLVVMRYGKELVPLDRAVVQAGIQIVVNLGLMVAAIFVATYAIEDAFLDPWWRIILKTCAIGLCPDPVGQIIGAQIGDINGDIAKVFITVSLYVGLFLVLFRINILHTAGCVLVIWVIRTTVDYSLYKLEGMKSDSWI